jgi:hypothetical protein
MEQIEQIYLPIIDNMGQKTTSLRSQRPPSGVRGFQKHDKLLVFNVRYTAANAGHDSSNG